MKPFVNYIGSKYKIMNRISDLFPRNFNVYFEPFVGGGSVFLYLNDTRHITANYINDMESGIISCYQALKSSAPKVIKYLQELDKHKSKRDFEYIVGIYNSKKAPKALQAALFIYLSKIAFNSRLNYHESDNKIKPNFSKANTSKNIYEEENLKDIAKLLKRTTISKIDFEQFLNEYKPQAGDFVFFDPPYFVEQVGSYYKDSFTLDDYKRLLSVCENLSDRKVQWMITVNKTDKIKQLFKNYHITTFEKYSRMSSGKGKEYEMVIRNYM